MHSTPVPVYIALGANLGDAQGTVLQAIADIAQLPHTTLVAASSLYRSAPLDSGGPDYINAVVQINTLMSSYLLLKQLQNLEQIAGRERPYINAPRTLDLDVLLYGNAQINSPTLTVPHPRMLERAFVLQPLHEIAPQLVSIQALQHVRHQGCSILGSF
jgi:2-amino-4-hydroxy-6-hydroxymethyldihydropteridine diphosphokinase